MAKNNFNSRSRKGKAPAKPSGAVGGPKPQQQGPKRTARAPPSPRSGSTTLSKEAVIDFLKTRGADESVVAAVAGLQQAGPSSSSTPSTTRAEPKPTSELVRLITLHVQHARQVKSWETVPAFLTSQVDHLAASIRPPGGPNDAFTRSLRAHGTDFCRAVQRTTRAYVIDQCTAVRRSLAAWRDTEVIEEARKIALKRLTVLYGKKPDAATLPALVQTALEAIPQRDPLTWAERADQEEAAAAAGVAMATD